MQHRISFLLLPAVSWAAVSWAAVITIPLSTDRVDEFNKIQESNSISSLICTSNCHASTTSLELRNAHAPPVHAKYDAHAAGPDADFPTSWKVAIGINAFVLVVTASILGMLVMILKKDYRKRALQHDAAYVGAKDGFGRRMRSARSSRGMGIAMGMGMESDARAWSYDPIREEDDEENGEGMGEALRSSGLESGLQGDEERSPRPLPMTPNESNPSPPRDANAKEHRNEGSKAQRAWKAPVRFSPRTNDPAARHARHARAHHVGPGRTGKEHAAPALGTEAHEYVQTP